MTIPMKLVGVRVQMPTSAPILVLREVDGDQRTVPIYIGGPEAHAIDLAVSNTKTARPMTHDLIMGLLVVLGAEIVDVTVTKVVDGTYFADLNIVDKDGTPTSISCRPSDAIAIAARDEEIPIFASSELVEEAGIVEPDPEPGEDDMVAQLRAFLDTVSPEDFGS